MQYKCLDGFCELCFVVQFLLLLFFNLIYVMLSWCFINDLIGGFYGYFVVEWFVIKCLLYVGFEGIKIVDQFMNVDFFILVEVCFNVVIGGDL